MSKVSESLGKLPKPVLIAGAVVLICGIGYFIVKSVFPSGKPTTLNEEIQSKLNTDFPDATNKEKDKSKIVALKEDLYSKNVSVNDYWQSLSLDEQQNSDSTRNGGLNPEKEKKYNGEPLDPTVYSAAEIYQIQHNFKTKEEVDRDHEAKAKFYESLKNDEPKKLTQEQQDSIYFARMEKTMTMVRKLQTPQDEVATETVPAEPEPKKIDIEALKERKLESVSFVDDGLITSLETPADKSSGEKVELIPARCTFLRNETIIDGQRVALRLMQDLVLSNGVKIPANTHVKGICHVGKRLDISITTVNYGGKIYYTNLEAFDNDGMQGIYCPSIVKSNSTKAGQKIAKDVLSDVGSAAASVFGNVVLGNVARDGINAVKSSIDGNGNINVSIASGYEFYVYESVDKK